MDDISEKTPSIRDDDGFGVVAIGASAGGLNACERLIAAMPVTTGMAFILVQHLEPTHRSLMAGLLASHTKLSVSEAAEGMVVEPDHLYVIPPATYLSVSDGRLRLSPPKARRGARLPFDFLLHSVAKEFGPRATCVVLSGTGRDGSTGLRSVVDQGGRVFAQDPKEAEYDGMPRSAIDTGAKVVVLPVAEIAKALVEKTNVPFKGHMQKDRSARGPEDGALGGIIELLRANTPHDFRNYKSGTLERRIQRRMGLANIAQTDMAQYLERLRTDAGERDALGQDLLINVTAFFRDPKVYAFLSDKIVPALIAERSSDRPVRLWIAGCSTGEEAYSLAMLFLERIAADKLGVKLQVFASDIDAEAVATAREGLYPASIEADVSAERLERFFVKGDHGYRISPDLRAVMVFTVQDVLADPPFSRIDLVSCRNLLIYLDQKAQARVISLLHFALRSGGRLLLGSAETIGKGNDRFELVSKADRVYRQVGLRRSGELGITSIGVDPGEKPTTAKDLTIVAPPHGDALAELCRRLVIDAFAPAVVLIDDRAECLFSLGPTERYLHVPVGAPTQDLVAMAHRDVRTTLRAAIHRASREKVHVLVPGGRTSHGGREASFAIDIRPVTEDGQGRLLVSFVEDPIHEKPHHQHHGEKRPASGDLDPELEKTRKELQAAVQSLALAREDHSAMSEEASSVKEEFQSTNEELIASKEELQSLIEELTATNGQLQETLERQRTTSDDLQNVLFSTDVATLFLDADLRIRFFTPSTKALFSIIPTDVGRPLADLRSLAGDEHLQADARSVLGGQAPIEREVEAALGVWFNRRLLPYRTGGNNVEGVVITFTDVTERKHIAQALESSRQQAETATQAKSRFLAAASHDLRQPLQALSLLQGLLAKAVEGPQARELVARLDRTVDTMSGLLNTLLDINQIEAGVVQVAPRDFPIDDLLDRLRDEFVHQARAQSLSLRIVPCGVSIRSDPTLLEQVIRNLLANALKYTRTGKVLVGCRRRGGRVDVEVWDSGIGIPDAELEAIFEEYHQVDNAARERSRGLGLGLFIVRRLCLVLGHDVSARSRVGKGSVFSVTVHRAVEEPSPSTDAWRSDPAPGPLDVGRRKGRILIVEDDPDVLATIDLLLRSEGHRTLTAADGPTALDVVAASSVPPDLVIADYNLPNGMNGFEVAAEVGRRLGRPVPLVVLSGDIAMTPSRATDAVDAERLMKPVTPTALIMAIQRLLPGPSEPMERPTKVVAGTEGAPVVYVVDDDPDVREAMIGVLEGEGHDVEAYASCEAFLDAYLPGRDACLLVDAYLPGTSGLELLRLLRERRDALPAIMITGRSDVHVAVDAMKAGASDFSDMPGGRD